VIPLARAALSIPSPSPSPGGVPSEKRGVFLGRIEDMKAQEVIEAVVAQIVAELEKGALPWCRPWKSDETGFKLGGFALPLRVTGEAYRGINILALWCAASSNGFRGRYWMTFNQAKALKGMVRKGEKASGVIYADKTTKEQQDEQTGETVVKSYAFLKSYAVFNADQIDGLPEKFYAKTPEADAPTLTALEIPGQAWFDAVPAFIRHGGNRAYFSPAADFVQMPMAQDFKNPQAYASTLCHELVHWTGHKSRLDRLDFVKWGDDRYAFEELVAELGAAFGMANLGLVPDIREDHAPYLAVWLKKLKDDPKALMSAAAKASQAIDFLDAF
jgi:antirestriction protein ArdC